MKESIVDDSVGGTLPTALLLNLWARMIIGGTVLLETLLLAEMFHQGLEHL